MRDVTRELRFLISCPTLSHHGLLSIFDLRNVAKSTYYYWHSMSTSRSAGMQNAGPRGHCRISAVA